MRHSAVGNIVNSIKDISLLDKEYVFDILQKQIIEEKRQSLSVRIKEARLNYRQGKVKKGNLKTLLKDLNRA